jgi:hypothetical protein
VRVSRWPGTLVVHAEQGLHRTNEGLHVVSRENQRQIDNAPPFPMQGGMGDKGTGFGESGTRVPVMFEKNHNNFTN